MSINQKTNLKAIFKDLKEKTEFFVHENDVGYEADRVLNALKTFEKEAKKYQRNLMHLFIDLKAKIEENLSEESSLMTAQIVEIALEKFELEFRKVYKPKFWRR